MRSTYSCNCKLILWSIESLLVGRHRNSPFLHNYETSFLLRYPKVTSYFLSRMLAFFSLNLENCKSEGKWRFTFSASVAALCWLHMLWFGKPKVQVVIILTARNSMFNFVIKFYFFSNICYSFPLHFRFPKYYYCSISFHFQQVTVFRCRPKVLFSRVKRRKNMNKNA